MKLRSRKTHEGRFIRMQSEGAIKEVLINEDLLHPEKEIITVCYKGKDASGMVDFTPAEVEKLYRSVKNKMHLVERIERT